MSLYFFKKKECTVNVSSRAIVGTGHNWRRIIVSAGRYTVWAIKMPETMTTTTMTSAIGNDGAGHKVIECCAAGRGNWGGDSGTVRIGVSCLGVCVSCVSAFVVSAFVSRLAPSCRTYFALHIARAGFFSRRGKKRAAKIGTAGGGRASTSSAPLEGAVCTVSCLRVLATPTPLPRGGWGG